MADVFITLRNNRIQAVLTELVGRVEGVVDGIAADIQTRSASIAPVDTGALRESIYRSNGTESDYNDKAGKARSLKDDAVIVPEVNPDLIISPSGGEEASYTVVVGSAVMHGALQEFGTAFLRAQPFLLPAALGAQEEFINQMSQVANDL